MNFGSCKRPFNADWKKCIDSSLPPPFYQILPAGVLLSRGVQKYLTQSYWSGTCVFLITHFTQTALAVAIAVAKNILLKGLLLELFKGVLYILFCHIYAFHENCENSNDVTSKAKPSGK